MKIFITFVLSVIAFMATAQVKEDMFVLPDGMSHILQPEFQMNNSTHKKAAGSAVNVTFSCAEMEGVTLQLFYLHDSKTGEVSNVTAGSALGTYSIPKGTYTFCAQGRNAQKEFVLLFDEDIVVEDDMNYEIDFSKCVNHQQFRVTLPTGEIAQVYNKDIATQALNFEDGNCRMGVWRLFYSYINSPICVGYGFTDRAYYEPANLKIDNEIMGDVWINEVSDRLCLFQTRIAPFPEGGVIVRINADTHSSGVMTNDYNCLKEYDVEFTETPVGAECEDVFGGFAMAMYWKGQPVDINFLIGKNESASANIGKIWVDFPEKDDFRAYALPHSYEIEDEGGARYGILGNGISNNSDYDFSSIHHTFGITAGNIYLNGTGGYFDIDRPLENNHLSFLNHTQKIVYGNSAPILVASSMFVPDEPQYENNFYNGVTAAYVGRMGEVRESDLKKTTFKASCNGENVTKPTGHETTKVGEWEFEFVNNNVMVDEITGFNKTNIKIDNTRKEVWVPTLQMLQFRDNDGMVTDRFEKHSDGNIIIFAGDYQMNCDVTTRGMWYIEREPEEVIVEISPMREENWQTLEVKENDMYTHSSWGHGYTGKFEGKPISESENKWYDMRVTVYNADGNSQTQVISPAFRIGDVSESSVDEVSISEDENLQYYTIEGIKVVTPTKGELYIVRTPDGRTFKTIK